jgi:hypothetical protein
LETDPDRLALQILELRAYARMKAAIERGDSQGPDLDGELAERVKAAVADRLRAEVAGRG